MATTPDFKVVSSEGRPDANVVLSQLMTVPVSITSVTTLTGGQVLDVLRKGLAISAAPTLPTAANLITALSTAGLTAAVGSVLRFRVINTTGAGIDVTSGSNGGPVSAVASKETSMAIRFTNVTSGSAAYTLM